MKKKSFSNDKDISNAIKDIENIKTEQLAISNAYSIRNSITLILSEYFRKYHGDNSYKRILENIFGNYNLCYDLIQSRLLEMLADIVLCHTRDINFVLELPQQQKGQNKDLFHPRFIAILLRLGDLLDVENNRFNDAIFQTFFEKLPEKSLLHLKKHYSLKELLITDDEIAIKLDCPDTSTYRVARQTIDWIKNDLNFFALNWNRIVPKHYINHVPDLIKSEVLINGEDVAHLQLNFSKEQINNMLEGYNLYSEQFVCIREIIQNAVDASKIQLYRDVINGKYGNDKEKLLSSPYELFVNHIFERYPIYINVKIDEMETEKLKVYFEITDFGTGISEETLINISNVCVSYNNRKKDKEEHIHMPKWLKPTGGFGIGIQSVFTVTDILQIETKSEFEMFGKNIEIAPMKYGGYISATIDKMRRQRGTKVKFNFDIDRDELDYIMKENEHYFSDDYISFFERLIKQMFCNNLFILFYNNSEIECDIYDKNSEVVYINNEIAYQYKRMDYDLETPLFTFWDNINSMFVNFFGLWSTYESESVYFRGVNVKNEICPCEEWVSFDIDIYGEDVQDCLMYSRNKFTYRYKRKLKNLICEISKKAIKIYIDLIEKGIDYYTKLDILYVYLLSFKYNIYFNYKHKEAKLPIYILENNKYIIKFINSTMYINLLNSDFFMVTFDVQIEILNKYASDEFGYDEVCEYLNQEDILSKPTYIMCNYMLKDVVLDMCSVLSIKEYSNFLLFKCNMQKSNEKLYSVDSLEEFLHSFFVIEETGNVKLIVRSIGLERYNMLETTCKFSVDYLDQFYYIIISPLSLSELDSIHKFSKENFISSIICTDEFANKIKRVHDTQKNTAFYNHESILQGYIELISELYDYANKSN